MSAIQSRRQRNRKRKNKQTNKTCKVDPKILMKTLFRNPLALPFLPSNPTILSKTSKRGKKSERTEDSERRGKVQDFCLEILFSVHAQTSEAHVISEDRRQGSALLIDGVLGHFESL